MPIQVRCQGCDHQHVVADAQQGKKLRCKHCGTIFVADDNAAITTPPPPPPRKKRDNPLSSPDARKSSPPRKSGGWVAPVLLSVGGVLVLGCGGCIGGVFYFWPTKTTPTQVASATKPFVNPAVPVPTQPIAPPTQPRIGPPNDPPKPPDDPKPFVPPPVPPRPQPFIPPPKPPDNPPPMPRVEMAPWQVKPDPAAFTAKGPFDRKTTVPTQFMGRLVYPGRPSAFVALTPGDPKLRDSLQVHDLRTLKPFGKPIPCPFGQNQFALSADGVQLATPTASPQGLAIDVWMVASGQKAQTILFDRNIHSLALLDFAGPGQLLTGRNIDNGCTFQVWDVKTGQEKVKFTFDLDFNPKWGAVSPGGRYLVMQKTMHENYRLHFWDLLTGEKAGELEMQAAKDPWGQSSGLAFSPDGKYLALLWRLNGDDCWGKLWYWDMTTGQKVAEHRLEKLTPNIESLWYHGGAKSIQWLPDNSGWLLFSHLIVERDSGKVVGDVAPAPGGLGPVERRFLDANHVTTLGEKGFGGFEKFLQIDALPRQQLDAAIKKARDDRKGPK